MRDLFAAWTAGNLAIAVTPSGNFGNPEVFSQGYQETANENNTVTPVTPVTPENGLPVENAGPHLDETGIPDQPCPRCSGLRFWRLSCTAEAPAGEWRCSTCNDLPADVYTDACGLPPSALIPVVRRACLAAGTRTDDDYVADVIRRAQMAAGGPGHKIGD